MKVVTCDNGFDLDIIYQCEILIMNKLSWKVNIVSATDIQAHLFTVVKDAFSSDEIPLINDNIYLWISFCMDDYEIYRKYDQFSIVVSSILLVVKLSNNSKAIDIFQDFINNINYQCGDIPFNIYIQQCMTTIKEEYLSGEDCSSDKEQTDVADSSETLEINEHLLLTDRTADSSAVISRSSSSNIEYIKSNKELIIPEFESIKKFLRKKKSRSIKIKKSLGKRSSMTS